MTYILPATFPEEVVFPISWKSDRRLNGLY